MRDLVLLAAVFAMLEGCATSRGVTYEIPGAMGQMSASQAEQAQIDLASRRQPRSTGTPTDKPLKLLRAPQPVMPPEAIASAVGGTVTAEVRFAENGEPEAVTVRSSSSEPLSRAVASAMWQWRIEPATREQKPTKLTVVQTFSFRFAP